MTDTPPKPISSSTFWTNLAAIAVLVGAVLLGFHPAMQWLAAHMPAPATAATGCLPPTEHEVLYIGVAKAPDGQFVITGCTHAGGKGAYYRRAAK